MSRRSYRKMFERVAERLAERAEKPVDESSHAAELIAVRELAKESPGFDPLLYWETRAGELRRELEEARRG